MACLCPIVAAVFYGECRRVADGTGVGLGYLPGEWVGGRPGRGSDVLNLSVLQEDQCVAHQDAVEDVGAARNTLNNSITPHGLEVWYHLIFITGCNYRINVDQTDEILYRRLFHRFRIYKLTQFRCALVIEVVVGQAGRLVDIKKTRKHSRNYLRI